MFVHAKTKHLLFMFSLLLQVYQYYDYNDNKYSYTCCCYGNGYQDVFFWEKKYTMKWKTKHTHCPNISKKLNIHTVQISQKNKTYTLSKYLKKTKHTHCPNISKKQNIHTVQISLKSERKVIERGKTISLTHKYMTANFSGLVLALQ